MTHLRLHATLVGAYWAIRHTTTHPKWDHGQLPALVPELNYGNLDGIQNGGDAQLAWMQAASADAEERKKIADQLLEYCKLDTLAMMRIVDALIQKSISLEIANG